MRFNPLPLFALLWLAACGAVPAEQARGTPAGAVAPSMASLRAHGVTLGAAVAVDGRHLVTNAHVLRRVGDDLVLRSADGLRDAPAEIVAISPRMDLAVLRMPEGFLAPAAAAPGAPVRGSPIWALGPEGLGRAVVAGRVEEPEARMRRFGPGFIARLGVLMGFSGGPVVDAEGRVLGLTTALPEPGATPVLAALTGVDVVGLTAGDRRRVFVLGMGEALAEARRLTQGPQLAAR
ncbi:MAG: serine protease [Acetobacteraceae bacterium]|nr:serine protease [Acetobacteraceae bacterium]